MRKTYTLLLVMMTISLGLKAQTIVPDRPDQTESTVTVPLRSLQVESGVLTGNYENGLIKQVVIPTTLLRYGLTKNIELRLGQQFENLNNNETSENDFGRGDLELGTKIRLFKKEGVNTEIAYVSHLIVPTGSNGFTNDKLGTVNKLALSHELNDKLGLGYNVGYNYMGEGKGDLTYSVGLGLGLGEKIGSYLEFYGEQAEFSSWETNVDTGLNYLLRDNLQLDISFGVGLNHDMHYFALGCSWNMGKI